MTLRLKKLCLVPQIGILIGGKCERVFICFLFCRFSNQNFCKATCLNSSIKASISNFVFLEKGFFLKLIVVFSVNHFCAALTENVAVRLCFLLNFLENLSRWKTVKATQMPEAAAPILCCFWKTSVISDLSFVFYFCFHILFPFLLILLPDLQIILVTFTLEFIQIAFNVRGSVRKSIENPFEKKRKRFSVFVWTKCQTYVLISEK